MGLVGEDTLAATGGDGEVACLFGSSVSPDTLRGYDCLGRSVFAEAIFNIWFDI